MDHKISKDMISSGMIPSGEKTQADLGRTQYGSAPSPSSLMEAYRSIYEHHQKDADGKVIEHGEKEELNEGKMPEGLKNYLMKKGKKKDDKDMKEERVRGGGVSSSMPKQKQYQKIIDKLTGYEQTQKGVGAAGLIPDSAFSNPNPRRSDTRPSPKPSPSPSPSKPSSPSPDVPPVKEPKTPSPKPSKPYGKDAPLNMMTDLDLFDLVKGRLLDEGCDEQEAINIMVNLSEDELNEILGGVKGDGYIGHPRLGIKNPLNPPKKEIKKTNGGKGLTNKLGNRATDIEKMIQVM